MDKWIVVLVHQLLQVVSPALREIIVKSIKEWEAKARETKSPWDDILVGGVKWLLGIS